MRNIIKSSKKGKILVPVLATLTIISITTVTVLAAIPDTNGKVNACYNNFTKVLRVAEVAGDCGFAQTSISWDQSSSGGSKMYANRLEFPNTSTGNQTLLEVPEFGRFVVNTGSCSSISDYVADPINYTNTGSMLLQFDLQDGSSGRGKILPSGTSQIEFTGVEPINLTLSSGTGAQTRLAEVSIYKDYAPDDSSCYITARALVK